MATSQTGKLNLKLRQDKKNLGLLKNRLHGSIEGDQVTNSAMAYGWMPQMTNAMRTIEILTVLFYRSHQLCTNFSLCTLTASKTALTLSFILDHM